jgi:hypothetical protein
MSGPSIRADAFAAGHPERETANQSACEYLRAIATWIHSSDIIPYGEGTNVWHRR